jgi:hypothetical protein
VRSAGRERSDSRAASEAIGYILIFALIFTTVGIVSIAGLPTLEDARESEQLQNAERAFDVLNNNMVEVYDRGAPSRATELNADDGKIETGRAVTFNVTVRNTTGYSDSVEADVNPIVFSGLGQTEFAYTAGAVLRDQPNNEVMVRDPPFRVSDDRVFITLVETTSPDVQSTGGDTVLVRAEAVDRSINFADQREQINITVSDSPREEVWEAYFEDELGMSCTTGAELDCGRPLDPSGTQTIVTVQRLRISLQI